MRSAMLLVALAAVALAVAAQLAWAAPAARTDGPCSVNVKFSFTAKHGDNMNWESQQQFETDCSVKFGWIPSAGSPWGDCSVDGTNVSLGYVRLGPVQGNWSMVSGTHGNAWMCQRNPGWETLVYV